jgi:hypothetical protein
MTTGLMSLHSFPLLTRTNSCLSFAILTLPRQTILGSFFAQGVSISFWLISFLMLFQLGAWV